MTTIRRLGPDDAASFDGLARRPAMAVMVHSAEPDVAMWRASGRWMISK